MQTQSTKKTRGMGSNNKSAPRILSGKENRVPSLTSMKQDALEAFKNSASEKLESISAFLPEGMMDDIGEYAQQGVRWLRKNPGAATGLAVLSGLAVGVAVRQALVGGSSSKKSLQA